MSVADPPRMRPHLLDAAMFWTPQGGGGVHQYLATKRAVLCSHGWRQTLLAPGAQGSDRLDAGGWAIPRSGGYRWVNDRRQAVQQIVQAAPDIVEAADPYTLGVAVPEACARLGVPSVAFCHSDLPALMARLLGGAAGLRTRRGRWAERRARAWLLGLYRRYDLVLAPSRQLSARLQAWGLAQACHQPLGVDARTFHPAANDPAWRLRLQGRLGLPDNSRLLLYVGRYAPEKNLALLAAAVARLGPPHVLLTVGSGPRPAPAGPGCRVLPPEMDRARLARLVASCDAFVHAGDQESFGLSVLEAMACGTPVVVSAAGGLGELAQGAGLGVDRQTPEAWAEAITAALAGSDSARLDAARHRALAHDWPAVLDRLAMRYLQAMRAGKPCHRDMAEDPCLAAEQP
jgi:alpha-1,6-mannosyltransferase